MRNLTVRLLMIFVAAATVAGCGGGSSSKSTTSTSSTHAKPAPRRPKVQAPPKLVTTARQFGIALAKGDCAALGGLSLKGPLPASRCKSLQSLAPSPKLTDVVAYSAGAVASYRLANTKYADAVFVQRPGLKWKFAGIALSLRPTTRTRELDAAAGSQVLKRVLPAIAAGNCKSVASDFPVRKQSSPKRAAQNCFGEAIPALVKLLKGGIGTPASLGGNGQFQFWKVAIGAKKSPFLFVLIEQQRHPRYLLLSPFPGKLAGGAGAAGTTKKK